MHDEVRQLRGVLEEAQRLGEAGRHVEARSILKQAQVHAAEAGVVSPQLLWQLAVQCDYAGFPEEALTHVVTLLNVDPLSGAGIASARIISARVREVLTDPTRAADDPSTPISYGRLVELGEADTGSHLAIARHHAAAGRIEKAIAILDALVTIEPRNRDVWRALSALGKDSGRRDIVHRASEALLGLGTGNDSAQGLLGSAVHAQA